jgi:uncharacterized SAM-binding protein YcdF (DUF218 family)/tetratricopeptide (TPR) repeat protein
MQRNTIISFCLLIFTVAPIVADPVESRNDQVIEQALQILKGNRMNLGGHTFTCPSRVLEEGRPDYEGKQWLWDSCFHAMILAPSEPGVAREELRSVVANQWSSGMVGHMNYFRGDANVAPAGSRPFFERFLQTPEGAEIPQAERKRFTETYWSGTQRSDITQPPVLAMAVEEVLAADPDMEFLREMLPKLKAHYDYLAARRDPDDDGLISIIHPWESGWDNSQRWDVLLEVEDPSQKSSYDTRKMRLVSLYKRVGWNLDEIFEMDEFQAEPVDFNVLYSLNLSSLARLYDRVGDFQSARLYSARAAKTRRAIFSEMWDGDKYVDLLGRQGTPSTVKSAAMFYPMMLDGEPHGRRLVEQHLLNPSEFHTPYGLPTTSLDHPHFDGNEYWRGNVWINVNYFVWSGLQKLSSENPDYEPAKKAAAHLKDSAFKLLDEGGFYEFFNPEDGRGFGAKTFGWNGLVRLMDEHGVSVFERGKWAHSAQRHDQSIRLLTRAIQLEPGNAKAHHLLADSLTMRDEWEQVVDSLAKALEIEPGASERRVMLGIFQAALGHQGDYQQTLSALSPTDRARLESLCKLAARSGKEQPSSSPPPNWPPSEHAILALGSPVNEDGSPGTRLLGTLQKTLELADQDPEAVIIVTGGAVRSQAEGPAMKRWLVKNGVDEQRIRVEQQAQDTIGNAIFSEEILEQDGVKNVTLVTISYHLPRALAIVRTILGDRYVVSGVGGESDLKDAALEQRLQVEAIATYRDVYRASRRVAED